MGHLPQKLQRARAGLVLVLGAIFWIAPPTPAAPTTAAAALPQAAATITTAADDGEPGTRIRFEDVSRELGIRFRHHANISEAAFLPEIMGGGAVWLDFDRDGRSDLYLVDSGPNTFADQAAALRAATPFERPDPEMIGPRNARRHEGDNALFRRGRRGGRRNDGATTNTSFDLVRDAAPGNTGYSMGASSADFDNDGWSDLLVTNFDTLVLYRNNGDGTFSDVTLAAGLVSIGWATSSAWGDLDNDGFLDAFIANYVRYPLHRRPQCGTSQYCPPDDSPPSQDQLLRNVDGQTFADQGEEAIVSEIGGTWGNGLAVAMSDINLDGRLDIYVANDITPNFLHVNMIGSGGWRLEESALFTGTAANRNGYPGASMGVDFQDLDGDGRAEIVVTNYQGDTNNIYQAGAIAREDYTPNPNDDGIWFIGGVTSDKIDAAVASSELDLYDDASFELGVDEPSLERLAFGVALPDLDADGDADMVIANGHVQPRLDNFAQPNQVFESLLAQRRAQPGANDEATAETQPVTEALFRDVSLDTGEALMRNQTSRGLAVGDANDDGLPDIAIVSLDASMQLMMNRTQQPGERIVVRLRGRASNRDAVGARLRVVPLQAAEGSEPGRSGAPQHFEVRAGSSYLSQNSLDQFVGLGAATSASIVVRWPDGSTERINQVTAGQLVLIERGQGVVGTRALTPTLF